MNAPAESSTSNRTNEILLRRKFSLRQAFSLTDALILVFGALFAVVILGSLAISKREETRLRLANEAELARFEVDQVFQEAEHVARAVAESLPLILKLPRAEFQNWFDRYADARLEKNPAQFDIYYGLTGDVAQRAFRNAGMVYLVKKDSDLRNSPSFNDPKTFRRLAYPDPTYLKDSKEVWYHDAIRKPEDVNYTAPWFDHTYLKRVMISLTKAARDEKGKLLGIGGVDLTAGSFSSLLQSFRIGETGGIFLLNQEGQPLAPFLGRNVPMLGFQHDAQLELTPELLRPIETTPVFATNEGMHEVKGSDRERYLYQVRKLSQRPFYLVAYQRRSEAYSGLYWSVSIMVSLTVIFLALSFFIRQRLANFVVGTIQKILWNIESNREVFARAEPGTRFSTLELRGPTEIARISEQLNLLYDRLQGAFFEVRQEKERAELATKAKSRFLSVMSHEIRTPLNSMLGLTDVLLLSPLASEQVRHLRVLQRSGQSLLRILNDILDFSRLEAGKLHIENHEFDLYEMLYDVESLMRFDAEAKGLHFAVTIPDSNYCLVGDSIRIRQALLNLVGNAIKFTASGAISIRVVEAEPVVLGKTVPFRFEVSDTGIGMSAEEQAKLFSEFSQADASITRRYGGTGLGLVISRQIVELLGGKLGLESHAEKGSNFFFVIPLAVTMRLSTQYPPHSSDSREEGRTSIPRPSSIPMKFLKPDTRVRVPETRFVPPGKPSPAESKDAKMILVVDDDEDNHRLIDAYLKFRPDIRAEHAFSAREALGKIQAHAYELVLMDMQMPEMDGLDATAEIRRLQSVGQVRQCPVIMLSANTFAEDQQKSLEAGADEHVGKPIKLDRFKELLTHWMN
jgi:signal transduction histidine kinase/ActR/RegA family two-component response regulator